MAVLLSLVNSLVVCRKDANVNFTFQNKDDTTDDSEQMLISLLKIKRL